MAARQKLVTSLQRSTHLSKMWFRQPSVCKLKPANKFYVNFWIKNIYPNIVKPQIVHDTALYAIISLPM